MAVLTRTREVVGLRQSPLGLVVAVVEMAVDTDYEEIQITIAPYLSSFSLYPLPLKSSIASEESEGFDFSSLAKCAPSLNRASKYRLDARE